MKIYTRKGDKGHTSLAGGHKLDKDDIIIEVLGTLDELNSNIGLIINLYGKDDNLKVRLNEIQNVIFDIGTMVASIKNSKTKYEFKDNIVDELESSIDEMDNTLPKLTNFILPGGNMTSCYCHLARSVCRRCERLIVKLNKVYEMDPIILQYINRLSDYFFVLARYCNDGTETIYKCTLNKTNV